jgi:hypothetical protein
MLGKPNCGVFLIQVKWANRFKVESFCPVVHSNSVLFSTEAFMLTTTEFQSASLLDY